MRMLWNGELMMEEDLRISPHDRGYYFGDGIYEVFHIYGGSLYETDLHMDRLERSAKAIRLELPFTRSELEERLNGLLLAERVREGMLYMQATRGEAPRAHAFPAGTKANWMAYAKHAERPLAALSEGIAAMTLEDIRWHRCDIKSLNLLPNVLVRQQAQENGCGEVILHRGGRVTECSSSNVFIVRDGQLETHPADNWILHGVTRAVVLRLAWELDIPFREQPFTVEELKTADEVFVTSTNAEITPVVKVDETVIGGGKPGPLTRRLQTAFEETL